jgi:hypothetical protein
MTLLGREYGDMFSPVGARPITPAAEDYDLIAASGVFTPEEERLVRQFLMLMGHMYMEPDLMNWKFNSRNANFEADRVDVVGAIGLAFHGSHDSKKFIDHSVELMQRSIEVYCTPGSGKWYENPACYYLHAAKCRLNLAFHLATHGIFDVTNIARLKDFLRWGILLLTPATPPSYDDLRLGISDEQYRARASMRRVAPVGDHAHIGPKVPDHYLLIKQGPGGYRYHRTEGSIILFADGKPLIYDGGEAGETWRHSTLSFHAEHMPLAAGHVERFWSLPAVDFCQGVHPLALSPGAPVFLSDNCNHTLVEEATRRFNEPNPADSRSVLWMKDEYVILHDELNLPADIVSHWHLQVVSDAHRGRWDDPEGYRFTGRFGTDLQVQLPGQTFADETIGQLPILEYHRTPEMSFSMRHLALRAERPRSYLAVLRPLSARRGPLKASSLMQKETVVGVHVEGNGIADRIFFSRAGIRLEDGDWAFDGRYGVIARRADRTELVLLDGRRLRVGDVEIESDGPAIQLTVLANEAQVVTQGSGRIRVRIKTHEQSVDVTGRHSMQLPI